MDPLALLEELEPFTIPAVKELHRVYDENAARFEPLLGDDAMTFGVNMYRNSWYTMERVADDLPGWTSARPDGSLVICGAGMRIHVYKHGQDETDDPDNFRLDQQASETKRLIAASNAGQLSFDLEPVVEVSVEPDESDLRELVIIHAGNRDDGCCSIRIGAPVPADEVGSSPWRWIEELWTIERPTTEATLLERSERLRHDELPEPEVQVEALDEPSSEEQSE